LGLFPDCEAAAAFETLLQAYRIHIRNKPEFFGRQLRMDENDRVLGEEPELLPNATKLPLENAFSLAESMGGVCYPAHVDRESNGIVAVLGTFPLKPCFRQAEFRNPDNVSEYRRKFPAIRGILPLYGSDAHRPQDIPDCRFQLEVGEDGTPAQAVFRLLRGERA
jgi:hypothetical protein